MIQVIDAATRKKFEEKDRSLAEKDRIIEAKDREIAELKRLLANRHAAPRA